MPHTHTIRVYAQNTDHGGIVHHSQYLCFMERARAEWAYANGVALNALAEQGHLFVLRDVNIRYHRGATLGLQLDVLTRFKHIGKASVVYHHVITGHQQPDLIYASADITVVMVSPAMKPQAIPTHIKEKLTHDATY